MGASGHEHAHGEHGHQGDAEQLARKKPLSGPANMATRQLSYARALRAPMAAIRAEARRGITERGIFDSVLDESGSERPEQLAPGFDPDDMTPSGFRFDDPAAAHGRFMDWLQDQQDRGVLGVIEDGDNIYIRRALADGDRWATARLREAGVSIEGGALPPAAFETRSLGGRASFVRGQFNQPIPASTVRLLYQRNYDLLEGITSDTSTQVGRVLSEGFAQGQGPRAIARDIADRIDSVGANRATLLARHEILYAHNTAAKERFGQQGVERVKILSTDPCPQCAAYAGNVYPLRDIPEGGPPWHPRCVCAPSPAV